MGPSLLLNSGHFKSHKRSLLRAFKREDLDPRAPFCSLPEKKWKILYEGSGSFPGFQQFFSYLERKQYKKSIKIFMRQIQTEIVCPDCKGARCNEENKWVKIKGLFLKDILTSSLSELHPFDELPEVKKILSMGRRFGARAPSTFKTGKRPVFQ